MLFNGLDSTPVELSRRVQLIEQGDLLISNVRESDAGWYSCIRSNEAGSVIGQAYLGVMGMYFLRNSFWTKKKKQLLMAKKNSKSLPFPFQFERK